MPTANDTTEADLWAAIINSLTGGANSPLTIPVARIQELIYDALSGGDVSYLTTGQQALVRNILAELAADGINYSILTYGRAQMLAAILNDPALGGSDYVAPAVEFNSGFLSGTLTATNSGAASWSGWYKSSGSPAAPRLWVNDPEGNNNQIIRLSHANHKLLIDFSNADFSKTYSWVSPNDVFADGSWFHLLISADLNQSAGNKVCSVYINDAQITPTSVMDADAAFTFEVNGLVNYVLGDNNNDLIGDVADVWIAPNVSLLSGTEISEVNRRKFISALGKPVNPSGFPASAILFSGDSDGFATNQGSGGGIH